MKSILPLAVCLFATTVTSATHIPSPQTDDQYPFRVEFDDGTPLCNVDMRTAHRCDKGAEKAYACMLDTNDQPELCDHIVDLQLLVRALGKNGFCQTMTKIRAEAKSNQLPTDEEYLKHIKTCANEASSVRYLDKEAHKKKSRIVDQTVNGGTSAIKSPGRSREMLLDMYLKDVFLPKGAVIAAAVDRLAGEALQKMVDDIHDNDEREAAQTVLDNKGWATKTSVTDMHAKASQKFKEQITKWGNRKLGL
ncbi:hypothetical protein BDZ94DRAFT_1298060 [Collybia nuda]|uniref:Secreted protein n=1 Tax=Collybia nuda TaxID=64659 RepID=A0A9P5Y6H7_9AGAR|nr:hypothetical protein BDZ94DRAFT_1298060 [Collybia nuda]